MKASKIQQGVAPFEEKHRRYFDFQRRTGDLPVQKEGEEVDFRGVLHRDGSVLMSVSLDQLKTPELFYRSLAAKLVLGMPFKDLATVDSILLRELPPADDKDADIVMYVNSPGGSVTAGMAIFDTMKHIRPDVSTVHIQIQKYVRLQNI